MQELSKRSARLCARLVSNHLLGVPGWLQQLQANQNPILDLRDQMRLKLNYPQDKQWTERLKIDLARWTPDFLFKVAMVRSVEEPSPQVLDWASMLTWLTLEQAEPPGATMPINVFLYSVCGLLLSERISPLKSQSTTELLPEAIRLANDYLENSRPLLLSAADQRWLKFHLKETPEMLLIEAQRCSNRLREQFGNWGFDA